MKELSLMKSKNNAIHVKNGFLEIKRIDLNTYKLETMVIILQNLKKLLIGFYNLRYMVPKKTNNNS